MDFDIKYEIDRGTIVDSGTTDTYLPATVAKKFSEQFLKFTGDIPFTQENIPLTLVGWLIAIHSYYNLYLLLFYIAPTKSITTLIIYINIKIYINHITAV